MTVKYLVFDINDKQQKTFSLDFVPRQLFQHDPKSLSFMLQMPGHCWNGHSPRYGKWNFSTRTQVWRLATTDFQLLCNISV